MIGCFVYQRIRCVLIKECEHAEIKQVWNLRSSNLLFMALLHMMKHMLQGMVMNNFEAQKDYVAHVQLILKFNLM